MTAAPGFFPRFLAPAAGVVVAIAGLVPEDPSSACAETRGPGTAGSREPRLLALAVAVQEEPKDSTGVEWTRRPWALGVSAGIPQITALTVERSVAPVLRLQANFGTLLLVTSINARALVIPERLRFQPYVYVGGGSLYVFPEGSWDGWNGFAWYGFGVRYRFPRVIVFIDIGEVNNISADGSGEEDLDGYSGGVLFRF